MERDEWNDHVDASPPTEIDSAPKPVSEAELEAQHASKLKQASAGNNQEV